MATNKGWDCAALCLCHSAAGSCMKLNRNGRADDVMVKVTGRRRRAFGLVHRRQGKLHQQQQCGRERGCKQLPFNKPSPAWNRR